MTSASAEHMRHLGLLYYSLSEKATPLRVLLGSEGTAGETENLP